MQDDLWEVVRVSEENYNAVLAAIPFWKPTRECRSFGITAIKNIVKCTLAEAIEIRDRLSYEGALPKVKY